MSHAIFYSKCQTEFRSVPNIDYFWRPAERLWYTMVDVKLGSDSSNSRTSEPVDYRNEDDWADIENDVEISTFVSLFDDRTFTDLNELLRYCRAAYDFDLWKVRKTLGVLLAHMSPNGCFGQPSTQLTRTRGQAWTT